mmetsp:Transcript_13576/g.44899  ORF Transcript_13576/g.44899 Transcript_13576/m.44899 type:complete len:209 (+) Transcript_13576:341-967(+)
MSGRSCFPPSCFHPNPSAHLPPPRQTIPAKAPRAGSPPATPRLGSNGKSPGRSTRPWRTRVRAPTAVREAGSGSVMMTKTRLPGRRPAVGASLLRPSLFFPSTRSGAPSRGPRQEGTSKGSRTSLPHPARPLLVTARAPRTHASRTNSSPGAPRRGRGRRIRKPQGTPPTPNNRNARPPRFRRKQPPRFGTTSCHRASARARRRRYHP